MAALTSAADIPPGGEGTIKASVHTRGRSGALSKTVTVETSDPDHRRVILRLKAKVIVEAALQPRNINLGHLSVGDTVTKTATLVARDPEKTKLTKVEVTSETEGLSAKIIHPEGHDAIEVTYKATKVGSVRGQLRVSTSSEKTPVLNARVWGTVLGNWEVLPRAVSFPAPEEGGEPVKRSIRIKARHETNYRVTKAVDSEGALRIKLQKAPNGYTLDLTLTKVPEKRRGVITITTTDPQERTIQARYYVRSKRRSLPRPVLTPGKSPGRPTIRPIPPRED